MIDTGTLHRTLTNLPPPEAVKRFEPCGVSSRRVFNPPPEGGKAQPRLTFSVYPNGTCGLTAEVSFPEMLHGDNRIPVTDAQMPEAFDRIDKFVYGLTGLDYNARTANVIRADYPADFFVGKENVFQYLRTALSASLPQMDTWTYSGTVYLTSKGKNKTNLRYFNRKRRRPRAIRIYDKGAGVVRVETSFCQGQALNQLAARLGYQDRKAETLFNEQTSYLVSTATLDSIGLSMPIQNADTRIDKLLEKYPSERECKNLIAFLQLVDRYGQEFYKSKDICGYDKRSYDRDTRKLKEAGVWLSTTVSRGLPPLRLARSSHEGQSMAA